MVKLASEITVLHIFHQEFISQIAFYSEKTLNRRYERSILLVAI